MSCATRLMLLIFAAAPFMHGCQARQSAVETKETFGELVENYYQNPQPDRLVPTLLYYSNSELCGDQVSRIVVAQFYASLLSNDPVR